jgi:hypothetical protein
VVRGWRRLHNEELHNMHASLNIIWVIKSRRMRWVGHAACMEAIRNAYNVLVEKLKGKRPLGRPRNRWEDNIRTDLREIWWEGVDWVHVARDRDQWQAHVNMIMNICVL